MHWLSQTHFWYAVFLSVFRIFGGCYFGRISTERFHYKITHLHNGILNYLELVVCDCVMISFILLLYFILSVCFPVFGCWLLLFAQCSVCALHCDDGYLLKSYFQWYIRYTLIHKFLLFFSFFLHFFLFCWSVSLILLFHFYAP